MGSAQLRTAAPMGDWRSFKFIVTVSAGLIHGDLTLIQETVGSVFIGRPVLDVNGCTLPLVAAVGEECVLIYHAEKILVDKLTGSGEVFLPGDKVYWSGVTGTGVSPVYTSGWYWIGICVQPADADVLTVVIDLKGDKATLLE